MPQGVTVHCSAASAAHKASVTTANPTCSALSLVACRTSSPCLPPPLPPSNNSLNNDSAAQHYNTSIYKSSTESAVSSFIGSRPRHAPVQAPLLDQTRKRAELYFREVARPKHGFTNLLPQLQQRHLPGIPFQRSTPAVAQPQTIRAAIFRTDHQTPESINGI